MNLLLGMSDGIGRRLRSTPYGISPVKKINLPYSSSLFQPKLKPTTPDGISREAQLSVGWVE
ncbi:hypothetical protein [Cylindrospermopsis raciborskii]|uniref:hypothetical protein n=1 Tax=Cylindrospermopsis raciborskii TaxID=77022 RepID=UPI001427D159|nr:hypothetical protein [Cylindrospermopsis raciborskii]